MRCPRIVKCFILFIVVSGCLTLTGWLLYLSFSPIHKSPLPVEERFISQRLKHNDFTTLSETYFNQRFFVDFNHWKGAEIRAPILVFLGGEYPIELILGQVGLVNLAAKRFGALIVYVEHRFYGRSIPMGSIEIAMADPDVRGCLTTDQALADVVEIVYSLKRELSSPLSPVIIIGSGYSGMLAAWFRIKYHHVAVGAVASSAPIFYAYGAYALDDESKPPLEDRFCSIVSEVFKLTSPECYDTIIRAWYAVDDVASQPNGLDILSQKFNTCRPLASSEELKSYVAQFYIFAAKYNDPHMRWIDGVCQIITNPDPSHGDILTRLSEVISYVDPTGTCRAIGLKNFQTSIGMEALDAWKWQLCSEMVFPTGCNNDSMLPLKPHNLTEYLENCQRVYGISPRPNVMTKYYGGEALNSTLAKFGSNIIFSNGLRDPLSSAGFTSDVSKTIIAITTSHGSHALDMDPIKKDDPNWLINQRERELEIMSDWIGRKYKGKFDPIVH